ncbi:biotin-dependent carboxyltransferase family protein [Paenibacillus thermoaerophilus]|nr:biotin-dependent carboxyltransferase family protein [Paenibacillus thermoaerophilus]TMV15920.1 biotin-dependent carboxyltransferase family protein [Paenibacillus thermoaerophilus]
MNGTGRSGGFIRVLRPGLATSVQDLGRRGYRSVGVPAGGAADPYSLLVANLLVGNAPDSAALEATLAGPELLFEEAAVVAVTGADWSPAVNGRPIPMWRPVAVPAGSRLAFAAPGGAAGARAYVAVAGGLDVPQVLGGRGAYARAGFGGHEGGRPLAAGDRLALGEPSPPVRARLRAALACWAAAGGPPEPLAPRWRAPRGRLSAPARLRAVPGPEAARFSPQTREAWTQATYRVLPASDRMGCRLSGPAILPAESVQMYSGAVVFGTVQIPPNGQPILLLADSQTTGGYPRMAQVIAVDLPVAGQLKPGDEVRFEFVTYAEAERLLLEAEADRRELAAGIRLALAFGGGWSPV